MNHSAYFEAEIPTPWRVLGLDLKPFSLGHRLILRRRDSLLMSDCAKAGFGDLAEAVAVCSMDFETAAQFILQDNRKEFSKWAKIAGKRCAFNAELATFLRYKAASEDIPGYKFDNSAGAIEAPTEISTKLRLMEKLHLTESQVNNMPWRKCIIYLVMLCAFEGRANFFDDSGLEEQEAWVLKNAEALKRMHERSLN